MICETALEWKTRVCSTGCLAHTNPADCEGPLQAHHIIYKKHLNNAGLSHLLYDTRNGLAVCDRSHDRHHSGHGTLPRTLLPPEAWEFANEIGMGWRLERYYTAVPTAV